MKKAISLFSQRIDNFSFNETYKKIVALTELKSQSYVFAMNINILLMLQEDQKFRKIHDQAKIIFADGVPLIWLSKFFSKNKLKERVSGTDLVEKILKESEKKVFLVGSTPKILKKMQRLYPKTVIGFYSPPFLKNWPKNINQKIIQEVNQSKAEIAMVGVGPLKQERWLIDYLPKTKARIGMGVGSAFDILSEEVPRAPKIMKDTGFEWLWRIILEPKRLFVRYLKDAFKLLSLIINIVPKMIMENLNEPNEK